MSEGLMMARMLTMMIDEETMINRAIESLQKYKEEKFKGQEKKETTYDSIKESLLGGDVNLKENSIEPPLHDVMGLVIKWQDQGRSMKEIMEDSEHSSKEISKTDLGKDE